MTDGIQVRILKKKTAGNYQVAVIHEATSGITTVTEGVPIALGAGAGKVRIATYTDAAAATEGYWEVIGYAAETCTVSTTDDHVIIIDWGK